MQGKYFFDAIKSESSMRNWLPNTKKCYFGFFFFMCVHALLFCLIWTVHFFKDLRKTVLMENCSSSLTMVMTMLFLFCENESISEKHYWTHLIGLVLGRNCSVRQERLNLSVLKCFHLCNDLGTVVPNLAFPLKHSKPCTICSFSILPSPSPNGGLEGRMGLTKGKYHRLR